MGGYRIRWGALLDIGAGLAALAVYWVTLSPAPFPLASARLIVEHAGLGDTTPTANPLWTLLVRLVALLHWGTLSGRLNVLSAVCGAVGVWLFGRVIRRAVWLTIEVNDRNRVVASRAAAWAGLAGALFLAFCPPYWFVATRAHPASFHLLMLFLAANGLLGLLEAFSMRRALALAFFYGLGVVEFATFILFGPLFLAAVLFGMWREGRLKTGPLLALAGAGVLGLSLYLWTALAFRATPTFVIKGAPQLFRIVIALWRDQYVLIAKSLPRVGWLIVLLVGVVPWLAVLLVGRRALNEERDWGFYILHVLLSGVVIAALFNVRFAPWPLLGPYLLLVTPYALLAACYGYLLAYWFLLPEVWWREAEEPAQLWLRRWTGPVFVAVALGLTVVGAVRNWQWADTTGAAAIHRYAHAVVAHLSGRTWLVTDGALDDNVRLAAVERGVPVRLMNLRFSENRLYMRALARQFADPRLDSVAELGLTAFLREWLTFDSNAVRQVASVTLPDPWLPLESYAVPQAAVFVATEEKAPVDVTELWQQHQAFWGDPVLGELARLREGRQLLSPLAAHLLRSASLIANNCGVLLEDLGHEQEAFAAYGTARRLDPDNISALFNQKVMVDRGFATPEAEAIRRQFDEFLSGVKERYPLWSLARTYGYVRSPAAFADLGLTWVLSGQPRLAIAGFKRALALAPGHADGVARLLAQAYVAEDRSEEGEAVLRQLVAQNPTNRVALLGLVRLAATRQDFAEAERWLREAESAGVPRERVTIEWALLHVLTGDLAKARIMLEQLLEERPDLTAGWTLLAGVLLQQQDRRALAECERKLNRLRGRDFLVEVVKAHLALARDDIVTARSCLEQALLLRPGAPGALELSLRLDLREGRDDLAERHVRELLTRQPEHAFGNYVLGWLQIRRGEYGLAETTLRRSLAAARSFAALNDLAWILQERGAHAEAEALAREAVALNPDVHSVWDTLGVILTKEGRYAEAEEALNRAVALNSQDLSVQTHLAELYARRGDTRKAAELAETLLGRGSELNLADRRRLRELLKKSGQP